MEGEERVRRAQQGSYGREEADRLGSLLLVPCSSEELGCLFFLQVLILAIGPDSQISTPLFPYWKLFSKF